MPNNSYEDDYEVRRREEWNRKMARMRREKMLAKRRRARIIFLAKIAGIVIAALVLIIVTVALVKKNREKKIKKEAMVVEAITSPIEYETETDDIEDTDESLSENAVKYQYEEAENMAFLQSDNMQSKNAILINLDTNEIEGQVDYKARIVPASMTKVMTVLVAAEHIDSIDEKVAVSIDATDFSFKNDCSSVGFQVGEMVTIKDLFYGTILSSGGDAAAQLAMYVAGTQEEFVEMMNEKCEELGISETTHFTNTVGIYNDNHYSTCYDMAVIMNAAIENDFLKEVMSAKKYTTSVTSEHPEGILISNWFLRKIEDKDCGGEVMCAKTGYVVQSGNCAVSYGTSASGTPYIAVTANAHSGWRCIYDHVDMYKNFAK